MCTVELEFVEKADGLVTGLTGSRLATECTTNPLFLVLCGTTGTTGNTFTLLTPDGIYQHSLADLTCYQVFYALLENMRVICEVFRVELL
mmetsp:Transcript_54794/g.46152  ORF Transcript_54794/g.46152 Transcript_54794/m.46152 type:complete len:90 (-) Transcript_54794:47-316(-)